MQDSDETADSIKAGLPVVSVSGMQCRLSSSSPDFVVGDAADFAFSSDAPAQPKQFLLSADKPMPSGVHKVMFSRVYCLLLQFDWNLVMCSCLAALRG